MYICMAQVFSLVMDHVITTNGGGQAFTAVVSKANNFRS